MISIDKAKQLKELGLKWEPKEGDWYKSDYWPTPSMFKIDFTMLTDKEIERIIDKYSKSDRDVWLPRLDQLLKEIEKNGYGWDLDKWDGQTGCEIIDKETGVFIKYFDESDVIEEVVTDGLIWILGHHKC